MAVRWCSLVVLALCLAASAVSEEVSTGLANRKLLESGSFGGSSSVTCTAFSRSRAYASAQSACVKVVALAFAKACGRCNGVGLVEVFTSAEASAFAQAYASVVTTAITKCTSSGDAKGCAVAKAEAAAFAKASAQGFAFALAKGFASCQCLKPGGFADGENKRQTCNGGECGDDAAVLTAVKSKAFAAGAAQLYIKLMAAAHSFVESATCVSGNADAGSAVRARCIGEAATTIIAKATAYALARARCWTTGTKALAEITALVEAPEVYFSAECKGRAYTYKWGNAATGFVANTCAVAYAEMGDLSATVDDGFSVCFGDWCLYK